MLAALLLTVAALLPVPTEPPLRDPTDAELQALKKQLADLYALEKKGDWKEAEKASLALIKDLEQFVARDSAEMCRRHTLLGKIYREQGRFDDARTALRPAVDTLRKYVHQRSADTHPADFAQALFLLGQVENDRHDTVATAPLVEELVRYVDSNLKNDELLPMARAFRATFRNMQGDVIQARHDYTTALNAPWSRQNPDTYFVAALHLNLAVGYVLEAESLRYYSRPAEARVQLAQAETHLRKAEKFCQTVTEPTPTLTGFATQVELGRQAVNMEREALAVEHNDNDATSIPHGAYALSPRATAELTALGLNFRASVHNKAGNYPAADADLTRAIELITGAPNVNRRILIQCRRHRAEVRGYLLGRFDEAVADATVALALAYEATLDDLAFQSLRQQQITVAACEPVLRCYVSLAIAANRPAAEIYDQVFRWKGVLFSFGSDWRIPDPVRGEYQKLLAARAEAAAEHRRWGAKKGATDADRHSAREELERHERKLAAFRRKHAPLSTTTTPAALAARLPPGAVFLDYTVYLDGSRGPAPLIPREDDFRLVAFVLRSDRPGVELVKSPVALRAVNRQILRWRELLRPSADDLTLLPEFQQVSHKLSAALWQPVERHCDGARLLWICPTETLWAIPFATLPDGAGGYLGGKCPTAYVHAGEHALALLTARPRVPAADRSCVGVSDIKYAKEFEPVEGGGAVVDEFAARFTEPNRKKLAGPAATKDAVLAALRLKGANVCIVGHGPESRVMKMDRTYLRTPVDYPLPGEPMVLTDDPFQLALPLTGAGKVAGVPTNLDCWLALAEIAEAIPAGADRAEWWACWAALGACLPTEGLLSFPRTLLQCGYRTVVAGQWDVNTQAALVAIAHEFHGRTSAGVGDAVALQQAQRRAIALGGPNAHPYHWGAWCVIGDPGPLPAPTPEPKTDDSVKPIVFPEPTPEPPADQRTSYFLPVAIGLFVVVVGCYAIIRPRRNRGAGK